MPSLFQDAVGEKQHLDTTADVGFPPPPLDSTRSLYQRPWRVMSHWTVPGLGPFHYIGPNVQPSSFATVLHPQSFPKGNGLKCQCSLAPWVPEIICPVSSFMSTGVCVSCRVRGTSSWAASAVYQESVQWHSLSFSSFCGFISSFLSRGFF